MAMIKVHTGIHTSPKLLALSDGALRLWLHGLCWCGEHLTDGFIPVAILPTLHVKAVRLVPELLRSSMPGKSPLWEPAEGGYQVHDYADWQDECHVIQRRRQKNRERIRRYRDGLLPDPK